MEPAGWQGSPGVRRARSPSSLELSRRSRITPTVSSSRYKRCQCCPYGYHIDVDFMDFMESARAEAKLKSLHRLHKNKRSMRENMESAVLLQDPTAIKQDTTVMCLDPQDTNQSIDDLEFFNRYVMDDINQSINGAMEYIDNLFSARSTDRLGRGLSSSTQNQSEINNTYREGDLLDAASFPKFNLERSRSVISTPVPIRRGISSPLLLTRGNTDSLTRSFDRRNRGVNIHPVETFDNVTSNDFDMNSNLPGNGNSDSGKLSANEKPNRDSILNDDVSDKFMENTKTVSENGQNNNSSEYSSVNLDGPDMKCSTPVVKNNKLVMDTNNNNNNSGKIEKTIAENEKQKTVNKTNENQSLTIGLSSPYDSEDSNSSRDEKVEFNLSSDCLDDSVISQERIHQNENTVQKQSKVETADKVGDEKKIESQAQNEIKIQTESKLRNENIAENDSAKTLENSLSKNSIENLESVEPDKTVVAILSNKEMNQLPPSEPNTATNSASSSAKLARAIAAILPRNLGRGNGGCSSVTFDTATLSLLRHHIAASLEEMRRLESLVKAVPILQVRISVLREEKRLLKLELMTERIDNKQNMHKVSSATDDLNSDNELTCGISRRISDSEFNPNYYSFSSTQQIQSKISGENASNKSTCADGENKKSNDVILCAKCKLNLLKTDRDCNSLSDSQSERNLQENLLNKSQMNKKRSTSRKLSSLPDISSRKSVFKKLQRHQDSDHKDAAIQCYITDNDCQSNSRQYGDLLGSFPKPKQLKKVTLSKLESASRLMKLPSNEGHSECHEDLKNGSALENELSSLMDTRLKPLSNKNISEIQRDESFSEASRIKLDSDRKAEQPPDLVLAHGALDYKTLHGRDDALLSLTSFTNNEEENTSKLPGQHKGFDKERSLEKHTKSAVKSEQNIGCDVGTMTENFEEINIKPYKKVLVDKYVNTDEIKIGCEIITSSTNTDSVILVSSSCSTDVIPKVNQFTEIDICCSEIERNTKVFVNKLINTDEIKTVTAATNTKSVVLASSSCLTDPIQKTNQSTETDVFCSGVDSNSKLMVDQFVNTDETKVETSSTNTESVVLVDSSCLTDSSPIMNKIADTETHYSDSGNSVNNKEIIITCDTYMPYMQNDTSEFSKNLYENKSAGSAAVESLFKKQIDTADTSVQTEKYSDSIKPECCDVMCEAEIKTQTTDVMCEAQIRPQSIDVMCEAEIKTQTTDVMCEASIKPHSSSVSCDAAIKPLTSDASCMAAIKMQSKEVGCEIKPCQCDVQSSANILPHMKDTGCTANIRPKTNDFCCEFKPQAHDKFCSTESLCRSQVDETCETYCDKSLQISKKSVENASHKNMKSTENSARTDKYSEERHSNSDISTRNEVSSQKFNSTNISTEVKTNESGLLNRKPVVEAKQQNNLPAVKQQSTSIFPGSNLRSKLRLYKSEPVLVSASDDLLGQSELTRKWKSQFFVISRIQAAARDSDTDDSSRRFLFSLKLVSACRTCNTWLNDSVQVNRKQLNSASEAIKEAWFRLANQKDVQTEELAEFLNQLFSNSSNLVKFVINMTDVNGNTALHYAVSYGNCVVIGQLLDTGCCDVSIQNRAGCTALMLAVLVPMATEEQRQVFQRLTGLGGLEARIETTGQTALMLAASRNHGDAVRLLLDAGCDVNACDSEGSTALMCASEHGHSDVVKILLAHPLCDSSISDMDGSTALSVAMEAGHRHIGVLIYTHLNFRKSAMDSRSIRRSLRRSKKE